MKGSENMENRITIRISGDNSPIMAALDEDEKKIDLITSKLKALEDLSGRRSDDFKTSSH